MNDKNNNNPKNDGSGSSDPKSYSAFPGRKTGSPSGGAEKSVGGNTPPSDAPIPSQPRSFQGFSWKKKQAEKAKAPSVSDKINDFSSLSKDFEDKNPESAKDVSDAASGKESTAVESSPVSESSSPVADSSVTDTAETSSEPVTIHPIEADANSTDSSVPAQTVSEEDNATGDTSSDSDKTAKTDSPPQSSGAGGDTIRLRINPKTAGSRTFNTGGKNLRRRLPDIRRRSGAPVPGDTVRYGPFSLFFGFIWLIFKMIFFSVLMMGIGAGIGYFVVMMFIRKPELTVPNVAGMKVNEAFEVLSEKKLGIKKSGEESSALVAPGEIISQNPVAGATSKEDAVVGVVISSGRSKFIVPNVVNESRENAINKIKGAGLEVGNVLNIEDPSVAQDHVISQNPSGETGLDVVEKVHLMISSGPPGKALRMPDLVSRTVLEAKAALKALGISDVTIQPAGAPDDAIIGNQEPLVGKTIFQKDKVTLTIK